MAEFESNDPLLWGFPGHLSDEEQSVLDQIKGIDFGEGVVDTLRFSTEPLDSFFCRFLRARKFVLEDASTLIREAFALWQEHQPETLVDLGKEHCLGCDVEGFKSFYPHSNYSFDLKNRPVMYEQAGRARMEALNHLATVSDLVKYHWVTMTQDLDALFAEAQRERGDTPFQICSVIDLEGMTSKNLQKATLDMIKAQIAIDNTCFPELLGQMFIINAPRIFVGFWDMIKGWLDERTRSKIQIINTDYMPVFREVIGEQNLPLEYGGQVTVPVFPTKPNYISEVLTLPRKADHLAAENVAFHYGGFVDVHVKGNPLTVSILNEQGEVIETDTLIPENDQDVMRFRYEIEHKEGHEQIISVRIQNPAKMLSKNCVLVIKQHLEYEEGEEGEGKEGGEEKKEQGEGGGEEEQGDDDRVEILEMRDDEPEEQKEG